MAILEKVMIERNVLIVEDDVDFAETLVLSLQLHGHNVSVAYNGLDAIHLVNEKDFDVCFLDIKMPGMTGIESLQAIRKILPDKTRFVMMTGFRDEETLERARQAGAEDILLKPFEMAGFLDCVSSLTC
jgi:CheY-like chemotaxis protein